MIRENLPEDLKTYFGELDTISDFSQCEVMERTNYLFFTLTLYKLPDLYKVLGKDNPIYVYSLTIGKKARKTVNCTDILGGVFKYNDLTKHVTANYPIAFINAICCVLFCRWNCFILTTNNKGMFNDGDTAENFALSLKNIAYNNIQVVRFIKTLPTTDVDNIYAIGVSLGALTMIDVYAIEDSYKKVVIILGGTPIDEIIFSSSEGMVKNFYNRMITLYGGIKEAQTKITEVVTPFDKVVQYADGSGMSVITVTSGDTSIPSITQKQLIFTCKPTDIVAINYSKTLAKIKKLANGHYQSLVFYPYLIYRSIKFLSKKENKTMNEKLSLFFEWVKLVQRLIMVVLTAGLIYVMLQANVEMNGMKVEMNRIATLTERALDIAEVTRLDIMKQIEEIQRDGLKLRFRIW